MTGTKVLEIYEKMRQERNGMDDIWAEVIRYCFPQERVQYSAFGGDTKLAGWRRANPVCSYPVTFTQRLGSAIHANAFPANDYWFDLSVVDGEMKDDEEMRDWCRLARDVCHYKIRQGTNFYQESHAMMISLAALGTACFYTYYKRGMLCFRHIPIHKNVYIYSNSDGEIDTVALLHQWTAKEAIDEYGRDKVGESVRRMFDDNSSGSGETFSYVQLVYPKKTFGENYSERKGEKPYGDITVELDTGRVVKVGQHGSFPFAVPRFLVYSDDVYGRSPAMNAMPDIRAANALRKNVLDATVRAVKPPLFIDNALGDVSIESGALNVVSGLTKDSIWTPPPLQNVEMGKETQQEVLESLKQAFFIDVFQAIEQQKYMTATEVTERVNQKVESISPIVTRIQSEFSSKVVKRCLELLVENGDIPEPPIRGGEKLMKIAYISRLDSMIQQGVAAKSMNFINQLNLLGQTAAAMPEMMDVLDTDKLIRALGDANMLPAHFFRKESEVQNMRMARQQQAAAMQQAQQNSLNAKSAADLSQAQLNAASAQNRGSGSIGGNF